MGEAGGFTERLATLASAMRSADTGAEGAARYIESVAARDFSFLANEEVVDADVGEAGSRGVARLEGRGDGATVQARLTGTCTHASVQGAVESGCASAATEPRGEQRRATSSAAAVASAVSGWGEELD